MADVTEHSMSAVTKATDLKSSLRGEASVVGAPIDTALANPKWPGWPGYCVFRLIVPLVKVGSIIGRKGEFIKKICEETRARIRVLDGAVGTSDRIVLISGKEDLDVPLSPAMDAVLRIFKRVTRLSDSEGEVEGAGVFCSVRLLVAATHALSLIGKQGSVIKSIQENSAASVRVLCGDEVPFYVSPEERIVELQGETHKVEMALESVLGQLRKFLVDHGVLPLFEKNSNNTMSQSKPSLQTGLSSEFSIPGKRDSSFYDNDFESKIAASVLPNYAQDYGLLGLRSGNSNTSTPIVTQVMQTMQIPLSYAEDIIGIEGANIAYIRRTSGAILTVQESRILPDEITVEIKGTSAQVQTAQNLIQEFISSHREAISSSYGKLDSGFGSYYQPSNHHPYSSSPPLYGGGYSGHFRL